MRVLIVEDDASARRGLTELVRAWGHEAEGAADGQEGLEKITTYRPSAVLADMVMPRMDGLELLRRVKEQLAELTFVLITAQGSVDTAVSAMKEGAYDYLTKPVDPQRLRTLLTHVAERENALRDVASLRRQLQDHGRFGEMVGNAPALRAVYRVIEQAAPTAASVLVYGESGTGKELVAKTIHQLSGRNKHPFIAINCAAIPESLLENEIFGHERGAFTGAIDRRPGLLRAGAYRHAVPRRDRRGVARDSGQAAARAAGTHDQAARRPEGTGGRRAADCRHQRRPGEGRAARQAARRPLLPHQRHRHLRAAAARQRPRTSRCSSKHSSRSSTRATTSPFEALAPEAMRVLQRYSWPGNIRELRNVIERAVILSPGEFVEAESSCRPICRARRRRRFSRSA